MILTLITQIRADHLYYPHLTMMHHARRLHKNTKHIHIQTPCFKEQFLRTFLAIMILMTLPKLNLNISSISGHIEELKTLLSLTKHKFDIIAISESRIKEGKK